MKTSEILVCISRILYPFILLFGIYIIVNGHLSPGGGFQGGAILATAILISNFIYDKKIRDLNLLIKIEKNTLIIIIIMASLGLITKGEMFTSFFQLNSEIEIKSFFLIGLNFFIGIKVATGLVAIFSAFIEEGR